MDTTNNIPDPFDPAALRLGQKFADGVGVKKHTTTVPTRKPNRQDFVRVDPRPEYRVGLSASSSSRKIAKSTSSRQIWRTNWWVNSRR